MPDARFLRVVTFRTNGPDSAVDAVLRAAVLPDLIEDAEICDVWIGRREAGSDRSRVLASTWIDVQDSPEAPEAADAIALQHRLLAELGPTTIDRIEQARLAVHARFDRLEEARVLRVFHGRVLPGELDTYVAEAESGMLADAAVNDGLVTFALGIMGAADADAFVTVSAWTGWAAIEAATGGNIRRPFATRHAARLATFEVVHLEILPEAPNRRAPVDGPAGGRGT
ncbi:MAG: hypothetical protein H0V73_05645 [Chloroflexi bacterium]|nr:hypothetical protein [Chloroflexota bacterium]